THSSASPARRAGRDSNGVEIIFGTRRREQSHAVGISLTDLQHDFWSRHYTLAAANASSSLALIGNSRVAEILANVVYPLAVNDDREIWNDYKKLRAQLSNQAARIAAARLFACDPRQRDFVRSLVGQQGLLQIYEDFCLSDASDCANCPLPEQLRRWLQHRSNPPSLSVRRTFL